MHEHVWMPRANGKPRPSMVPQERLIEWSQTETQQSYVKARPFRSHVREM